MLIPDVMMKIEIRKIYIYILNMKNVVEKRTLHLAPHAGCPPVFALGNGIRFNTCQPSTEDILSINYFVARRVIRMSDRRARTIPRSSVAVLTACCGEQFS